VLGTVVAIASGREHTKEGVMTMRVTSQLVTETMVIDVAGKLVGPWVKVLEACWRTAGASHVCVDLTGATFIDGAGTDLLRTMHRERVELKAKGCFIAGIVSEIRQGEPRRRRV
jgi:anti-anti-sigma regulatory factor